MSVEAWSAAVAAPFVGSFLGLVAERLPEGRPILLARSECRCGRRLGPLELVPVASWLALRGRCAGCSGAIGAGPLAFELLALATALWAAVVLPPELLAASCLLGWTLLLLAAIDLRTLTLPDRLTLPLIAGGLALHAWLQGGWPVDQLIGAAIGFGGFAGLAALYRVLRKRDGLGLGDTKLLAAAGAWLGWQGLPTMVLAAGLLGIATAVILGRGRPQLATAVPFGPALAGATWLAWLHGPLALG